MHELFGWLLGKDGVTGAFVKLSIGGDIKEAQVPLRDIGAVDVEGEAVAFCDTDRCWWW